MYIKNIFNNKNHRKHALSHTRIINNNNNNNTREMVFQTTPLKILLYKELYQLYTFTGDRVFKCDYTYK